MKKNQIKKIIYSLCILFFSIYLIYRIFFTLCIDLGIICFIFSFFLLIIELWDSFDTYIYFFNILFSKDKSFKNDIIEYPDIDIFIATYNESEIILSNTISKCLELNYPNPSSLHIYLCDDGNRENIKKLAKKYNINYLSRKRRKNFKAGNYNNALNHSSSPYVVTLDADMAPSSNFLLETLPYFFSNKDIGFVQLPQSFCEPDIFQYRFNLENNIPFEQNYFYNFIQIKKNSINSTIYCGTNAIFLRKALVDANYFDIKTITEDIATGMKIQAKGYKGIAINKTLVHGHSVLDFDGFIKQRIRWARGCIQILKNSKILSNKNLTIKQKFEYLSCISYWFFGFKKIIYLLAPLLFVLFNIIPISCNVYVFLAFWLPSYILKKLTIDLFSNHRYSSTWNKIHETILSPILCVEVFKELLGLNKIDFEVSPKYIPKTNISKYNIKMLVFFTLMLILNIFGYIVSFYKFVVTQFNPIYILSIFFIITNIFYVLTSIIFITNNREYNIKDFEPNKVNKYSIKSLFYIFTKYQRRVKNVK